MTDTLEDRHFPARLQASGSSTYSGYALAYLRLGENDAWDTDLERGAAGGEGQYVVFFLNGWRLIRAEVVSANLSAAETGSNRGPSHRKSLSRPCGVTSSANRTTRLVVSTDLRSSALAFHHDFWHALSQGRPFPKTSSAHFPQVTLGRHVLVIPFPGASSRIIRASNWNPPLTIANRQSPSKQPKEIHLYLCGPNSEQCRAEQLLSSSRRGVARL